MLLSPVDSQFMPYTLCKVWSFDMIVPRTRFRLSLAGVLGFTAPGTTSVSNRRICLHSPITLRCLLSLWPSLPPSLSFWLQLPPPRLNHTNGKCLFFIPSLIGCSIAMHAPPVLPALTLGRRNSWVGLLNRQQWHDEEVCHYSVAWPCQPLQGEPHLGKGTPSSCKEGYQKEAKGSQTSQGHGQTQLGQGGWYFSTGPSFSWLVCTVTVPLYCHMISRFCLHALMAFLEWILHAGL